MIKNWEEHLRVTAVNDNLISLESVSSSACQGCITARLKKKSRYNLPKTLFHFHPNVGDQIQLSIPPFFVIRVILYLFGLPLLGMIVGSCLAAGLSNHESIIIMSTITGFCVGFWLTKRISFYLQKQVLNALACYRRNIWHNK